MALRHIEAALLLLLLYSKILDLDFLREQIVWLWVSVFGLF